MNSDSGAETRLVTYGSLSPGEVNHHQLAGLRGAWQRGTVRGVFMDRGWGSGLGFPGMILDPSGPSVDVHLFESPDLPKHWARLDEFEGPGYRRVATRILTGDGEVSAYIYELAQREPPLLA